jgi:hypothetical protein
MNENFYDGYCIYSTVPDDVWSKACMAKRSGQGHNFEIEVITKAKEGCSIKTLRQGYAALEQTRVETTVPQD